MRYLIIAIAIVMAGHIYQANAVHAVGSSIDKSKSLKNAYVSAHFKCNRKGIWADLDSLKVVGTDTTSYVIAGGKKKITQYNTHVEFKCTTNYKKEPSSSD